MHMPLPEEWWGRRDVGSITPWEAKASCSTWSLDNSIYRANWNVTSILFCACIQSDFSGSNHVSFWLANHEHSQDTKICCLLWSNPYPYTSGSRCWRSPPMGIGELVDFTLCRTAWHLPSYTLPVLPFYEVCCQSILAHNSLDRNPLSQLFNSSSQMLITCVEEICIRVPAVLLLSQFPKRVSANQNSASK